MNETAADVYKGSRRAAILTGNREGTTFRYVPGYEGPPVAATLPVTAEPLILTGGAAPLADVRLSGIPLSGHQLQDLQKHLNHQRQLLAA